MSLRKIRNELEKYNKNIDFNHQISAICVLNKGLVLNVDLENISNVTLYPSNKTILATNKGTIEDNFLYFLFVIGNTNNDWTFLSSKFNGICY